MAGQFCQFIIVNCASSFLYAGFRLAERGRRRRLAGGLAVRRAPGLQGGPRAVSGLVTSARH